LRVAKKLIIKSN